MVVSTEIFKFTVCNTPDGVYGGFPSQSALSQHRKTKQHKAWVERNELRLLKIELTEKTNQIMALENTVQSLKNLNTLLLKRLTVEHVSDLLA
jgi:predicted RNase H-like nuclease (RuvC/YqgF family)